MMQKVLACVAAALFSFYDLFELSLFNRLNTGIQAQFHISVHMVDTLSSSFLWANALGLIPVGILLDRGYARQTASGLLALAVASNLIFIYSHNLPLAFIARFVQGLASAGSLLTCMRLAIHWHKKKANTAIGWMIAIALSGGFFANFVTSWTIPFWVGCAILIFVLCFLHDTQHTPSPQPLLLLAKPKNFFVGSYLALVNFPVFILGSLWGNAFLAQHTALTLAQRSFVSSLIFAGIVVGSPFWGYLANHLISPKKILVGGCMELIFLCALLKLIPPHFFTMSIIFFGFGFFSCTQNMAYYVLSKINTPASLSSGTAIASVIYNGLGAISQMVFYSAPELLLYPFAALIFLFLSLY